MLKMKIMNFSLYTSVAWDKSVQNKNIKPIAIKLACSKSTIKTLGNKKAV